MKYTVILVAALGILLIVLSAGCTSPTQVTVKPQETTVPAPSPTTSTSASSSSSTATVVSTPVAAQTLPPGQGVDIYVEKQRPDATIHLLYNGGEGEGYVQNIMMRVARSDGIVEEKYLTDGSRKPSRGDELIMDGTRGIDQVAVFITSAGITYKVYDRPLMVSRY
jgi:hypothetical protein